MTDLIQLVLLLPDVALSPLAMVILLSIQPATSPAATGNEADHDALRQIKSTYEQAIRENHVDALRPYLHADFHG